MPAGTMPAGTMPAGTMPAGTMPATLTAGELTMYDPARQASGNGRPQLPAPAFFGDHSHVHSHVHSHAEDDDGEHDFDVMSQRDMQRFIFCSRAYMFDRPVSPVTQGARRSPAGGVHTSPRGGDLDALPSTMPPRFRHAAMYRDAQALPQLSDGGNETPPAAGLSQPVVTLLLPSAALQGIVGGDSHGEGAASDGAEGESAHADEHAADTGLMQVQCRVLNASRVSA